LWGGGTWFRSQRVFTMGPMRATHPLVAAAGLAIGASLVAAPSASAQARTARTCAPVAVPGAEKQIAACLDDLTTAGTVTSGHTIPADWAGLHPPGARNPSGVRGTQIDGYFPDTSTFNTAHGWNHDSQFVIRLPERWNGGLVVAGSPGVRGQYANDFTISDWVLAKGYAFAATDKGNVGATFYEDGKKPGDALAEWNDRVTQLAKAAKRTVARYYGRTPRRTYAAGVSNGGYLVRWQLEHNPELYNGGVDWEGTLWRENGPNLFTFLPKALDGYTTGNTAEIEAAGYPAASSFLWDYHYKVYWDLTQRIYRQEVDPAYTGAETAYDYASRPRSVHKAVRKISLNGRIGRPLITLHGTLDSLLPISQDSDVYDRLIKAQGRDRLHRYYRIEGGNHVDGLYGTYPDKLRPILPCFRAAFTALEGWTTHGKTPPPDATLPRPASGDLANECSLGGTQ